MTNIKLPKGGLGKNTTRRKFLRDTATGLLLPVAYSLASRSSGLVVLADEQDKKLLLGVGSAAVAFDPINLASCAYGFEADSGAYSDDGVTPATNGGSVKQWNDRSSNGRNLTQTTLGQRPGYSTSVGPNSKPTLTFSASSSQEIARSAAGLGNAPHTIFAVLYTLSVAAGHRTVLYDNNIKWGRSGANPELVTAGILNYVSTGTISATTWTILAWKFDTGYDVSFYKNGSFLDTSTGTSETSGNASMRIGGAGTEYWDGRIAAVYAFSADLSSDDMTSMWTYLNGKYAVY